MTVPEESREKTASTDEVVMRPESPEEQPHISSGATLREAFEEAGVQPEDFQEGTEGAGSEGTSGEGGAADTSGR